MTTILDIADTEPLAGLDPPRPHLRAVFARVAAQITTAVVIPVVLFVTTLVLAGVYVAVCVALAWMVAATVWRWATGRPVSGLLVLTLGIMTFKTAFTLLTGNTFVYFVQPVVVDAVVATIFLGSLLTARPVVARLAGDFYPLDAPTAARPRVVGLFRRLTLLWGLVIVVKGAVTLWLLVALSTVSFVVIKSGAILALTLAAVATTVAMSVVVGRQEGLLPAALEATGQGLGVSGPPTQRSLPSTARGPATRLPGYEPEVNIAAPPRVVLDGPRCRWKCRAAGRNGRLTCKEHGVRRTTGSCWRAGRGRRARGGQRPRTSAKPGKGKGDVAHARFFAFNDFHGNIDPPDRQRRPGQRHARRRRRVPRHRVKKLRAEPRPTASTSSPSAPATSSAPARWSAPPSTTSRRSRR